MVDSKPTNNPKTASNTWSTILKWDRFLDPPKDSPAGTKKTYKGAKLSQSVDEKTGETLYFLSLTDTSKQLETNRTIKVSVAELAEFAAKAQALVASHRPKDTFGSAPPASTSTS